MKHKLNTTTSTSSSTFTSLSGSPKEYFETYKADIKFIKKYGSGEYGSYGIPKNKVYLDVKIEYVDGAVANIIDIGFVDKEYWEIIRIL